MVFANAHDAILMRLFHRHFFDGDDIAAMLVISLDALGHAAAVALASQRNHVGQQHGKGLIAHQFARAPHRMAKTERGLLAGKAGGTGFRQIGHQSLIFLELAALLQRVFQLIGHVEMIFNHALVASGDEDEMLNTSLARFIYHMLQHRAVDHGHHFLGHGFGRWQKTGAKTSNGQNGFTDGFFHG